MRLSKEILLLLGLVIIIYGNTLFFDWTLDDTLMITQNKFTKKGVAGIKDIMTNDAFVGFFGKNKNLLPGGRYRPLSQVFFAIEYQLFGLNPFIGHLVNVLLYAILCILIFILLSKLFKKDNKLIWYLSLPFLATVLFITHPLHTEVIANVKGRDEILGLLFCVLTLFYSIKYIEKQKIVFLGIIFVAFILALLSKENAITFLAIIPLTIFFFKKSSFNNYLIIYAPLILATIVYFIIRQHALGFLFNNNAYEKELLNNPFIDATVSQKYATIMLTWFNYLKLIIFPLTLTHDYYPKQIPIIDWTNIIPILTVLVYGFLIVYSIINLRKKEIVVYSILFFMTTFSIQSNLVFNIGTFMNERFMFISLLGFCIIIAYYLIKLFYKNKRLAEVLFILLLSFYSVRAITRNFAWKDDFTLFTTDAKTSTNSAKCNVSAGGMLYERAKITENEFEKKSLLDESLIYLNNGVTIHPYYVAGWILMGNVYIELKDYKRSTVAYQNVLNISPGLVDALNNLLYVAQKADKNKKFTDAVYAYKLLLKQKPKDLDYKFSLASSMASDNKIDTAIIILNNILEVNKDYHAAYNKLGEIYGRYLNNIDKSIAYLLKAYNIKKDDASILENLGVAFGIKGEYNKSIDFFKQAIKIKPNDDQLYENISSSYSSAGDKILAKQMMDKATEIKNTKK